MHCSNHEDVEASGACAKCSGPFCNECLVEIFGHKYCESCKYSMVKGQPPVTEGLESCEPAGQALKYSIIGLFICGLVFGPMAIMRALEARRQINENPHLSGLAMANIGLLLGLTSCLLWVFGMVSRML